MAPSPDPNHLDLLALDALRAGEGTPETVAHVASCEACQRALAALEEAAGALRRRAQEPLEIPAEVDRAILIHARAKLARLQGRQHPLRQRWVAVAAAACLLIGVTLFLWLPRSTAPGVARVEPREAPGATVDIVDAYRLARRLRSGERVERAWDWNHDGLVDRKDVDDIVVKAVSLSRRSK